MLSRLLLVFVTAVPLAAVVLTGPAEATPPPYNVLAVSGTGTSATFGQDIRADLTAATPTWSSTGFEVSASVSTPGDSTRFVSVQVSTADSSPLAPGSYSVPSQAGVTLTRGSGEQCTADSGTLTVHGYSTANHVASFDLAVGCQENTASVSALVRLKSSDSFETVDTQPRTWDYGDQIVGRNGQPKRFSFTNTGVDAVTLGTPRLAGTYTTSFVLGGDDCPTSPATLAPGASCSVTVTPHARFRTSSTVGASAYLQLPVTGPAGALRTRQIPLFVQGKADSTTYVSAGPERATVHYGKLPAPFRASISAYRIDVRTPGHAFALWRDVDPSTGATTQYGLSPSLTYGYTLRPLIDGSDSSDWTPTIAARPWPKYGTGMYHRLTPFRLVRERAVRAGHPYVLTAGTRVPATHVSAVVLNVTVIRPSATTGVYVYPSGTARPAQADLTVNRGDTKSNLVIARVSSTGRFVIAASSGTVLVTVDVSGYFSASGLTTHGYGAALHQFIQGGTILDTRRTYQKPLPAGYFVAAPMNFDPTLSSRVTSLEVVVSAYGSSGSGTIAGFRTGDNIPGTSVLSYERGQATTATAIIAAGLWHNSTDGHYYPSISFYNRGRSAVQLKVTTLGYFDDASFLYGQRYYPSVPVHLLSDTLYSGSRRTLSPGRYATEWTSAMNLKITAASPTRATTVSAWPVGYLSVPHPVQPQLRTLAWHTMTSSTVEATGGTNRMYVDNSDGRTRVNVWSFGRFDAWPVPATPNYVGAFTALAGPVQPSAGTPFARPAPMLRPGS